MAKKNEKPNNSGLSASLARFVQDSLDSLYTSTHYTPPTNKHDLDNIRAKLDDSINNIVSTNKNNTGMGSLSTLFSRVQSQAPTNNSQKSTADMKKLEELLNDNSIMESGLLGFISETNTSIYDYDNRIDTIIKYMPKLQEALDTRKDNVLSADHFSKEYINVTTNSANNSSSYEEHIRSIKETYNFQDFAEELYDDVSKYGEAFVYNVPAKKAIARLISDKNKSVIRGDVNLKEQCLITEGGNIKFEPLPSGVKQEDLTKLGIGSIQIECNTSCVISSLVEHHMKYEKSISSLNEMSLNYESTDMTSSRLNEAVEDVRSTLKGRFEKTLRDDLSFEGFKDKDEISQDGLIRKKEKSNKGGTPIDIPGTIIKILPRHKVIPIYIEDYCFGYYYIESDMYNSMDNPPNRLQDPTMSMKGSTSILTNDGYKEDVRKQDTILKYLSNQISRFIDAKFVNANQDLRDEIYMVLKYNQENNVSNINKIRVTFIPPDDMEHVYFKKDKNTHRGISDLDKALFPATLFSSMYITNCIWTMTRSQDKRVYYVNSSVDSNISKVLLNTINQIKKGNMNIRQIENINNILNITGMFNDYVIPRNSSGQAPVDFEVMQGQQIEFKTELMNMLEEMAVNSTDVPIEVIQMRMSVDYATQLTMSSSKFLRKVYNRQSKYQAFLTRIFNRLYANEYDDNITLQIMLPPPMFLNITNTNQMITNVNEYATSVAQIMLDDTEDDAVKSAVIREINADCLGTYLNVPHIQEVIKRAKHESAKLKNDNGDNES